MSPSHLTVGPETASHTGHTGASLSLRKLTVYLAREATTLNVPLVHRAPVLCSDPVAYQEGMGVLTPFPPSGMVAHTLVVHRLGLEEERLSS